MATKNISLMKKTVAAGAGFLLLAAAVFAAIFLALPAASQPEEPAGPPAYLIYESKGKVYMALGDKTVCLPGADISDGLNGRFAAGSLYYLADIDKNTGAGALMRADMDMSEPALVAKDVCDAEISQRGDIVIIRDMDGAGGDMYHVRDEEEILIARRVSYRQMSENGERVLYIAEGKGGQGDLFSWDLRGRPYLVEHEVSPEFIGFSPDAKSIYYVTQHKDDYSLYVKTGPGQPVKVDEQKSRLGAQCFSVYPVFDKSPLSDNGQMLYARKYNDYDRKLYVYAPGAETDEFRAPCGAVFIFDDGSFTIVSDGCLYYKEPGREKIKLSEHIYLIPFFGGFFDGDMKGPSEKRFLLREWYSGWDEPFPGEISMFEQEIGKDKTYLCEADVIQFTIDTCFTRLAYISDETLYVMRKTQSGWKRPDEVCDSEYMGVRSDLRFDAAGRYFYYWLDEDDNTNAPDSGEGAQTKTLYRYDMRRKRSETFFEDIEDFFLVADRPYAVTAKGEAYALGEQNIKLADNIVSITEAEGGVYLIPGEESYTLYHFNNDSGIVTVLCDSMAGTIGVSGIEFITPVTKELKEQLQELYLEAKECIKALESAERLEGWAQAGELAASLRDGGDLPGYLEYMLTDFSAGFMWANMAAQQDFGEDVTQSAIQSLLSAVNEYEKRFGFEINM